MRLRLEQCEDRVVPTASLVADIEQGPDDSSPQSFINVNGTLFFFTEETANGVTTYHLRTSNGTAVSNSLAEFDRLLGSAVVFDNRLLFSASTAAKGYELWISNGTQNGTYLVKDIAPNLGDSDPRNFIVSGGYVYFTADGGPNGRGREIYRTQGTSGTTTLFLDVNNDPADSEVTLRFASDGKLYFTASADKPNDPLSKGVEFYYVDLNPIPPSGPIDQVWDPKPAAHLVCDLESVPKGGLERIMGDEAQTLSE